MSETKKPLPDFANPPVVEVALSVQFEAVKGLRTPQLGLFWQELKDRFPVTQEHAPLEPVFERFGAPAKGIKPTVQLQMLEGLPAPRCWFLNEPGTELVQIQPDRFIHNWRKRGDQESYPRFERLRETFANELRRFDEFLDRENLGSLTVNQCEVTYVNHITLEPNGHGKLDKILTVLRRPDVAQFLPELEDARLACRYVMQDESNQPIGRLHLAAEPAYRTVDNQPIYTLTLTARGGPDEPSLQGALRFIDTGREWVVRGFAAITTREMHKIWGRQDDR